MRAQSTPVTGAGVVGAIVRGMFIVFMLAPVVVVVFMSFSSDSFIMFPPRDLGGDQYVEIFTSDDWLGAVRTSFALGIPSTLLALLVGVLAVIGVERSRVPGRSLIQTLGIMPLVLPTVAYAVALYTVYSQTGLRGTVFGIILANMTTALPFVILVVSAGIRRIPFDLELVAMSLGASRGRALLGITVRLLVPSILAAGLLSFVMVFDEVVFITFLSGNIITLPKAIYDSMRTGLEPVISAVATLLMAFTGVVMLTRMLTTRKR